LTKGFENGRKASEIIFPSDDGGIENENFYENFYELLPVIAVWVYKSQF